MNHQALKVIPYLTFEGNCEEALNFYQKNIGGTLTINSRYDAPEMKAPENYRDKVLHARLEFNGGAVYASDIFPGQSTKKNSGDVSISLLFWEDLDAVKEIFNGLAAGGKVGVPFEKQFWGSWHGSLQDKYGISWNLNFEQGV